MAKNFLTKSINELNDVFQKYIEENKNIIHEQIFIYLVERCEINTKTQCWEWKKYINHARYGYGSAYYKKFKKVIPAHRLMMIAIHGDLKKFHVCHHCDNTKCINPNHLFLGTQKDNMVDKVKKNRQNIPKGVDNHRSILSEQDVYSIRKLIQYIPLFSTNEIGRMFGVNGAAVRNIMYGKSWKHLK